MRCVISDAIECNKHVNLMKIMLTFLLNFC